MPYRILKILCLVGVCTTARAALSPDDVKKLAPTEIEAALPNEHPSSLYGYAWRLFGDGKKDEAVFWFYVGQLRYRIYLEAMPAVDPSGDPALFASLNATIGQTINEYAGGDPKQWATQIEKALKWDDEHVNGLAPKEKFKEVHSSIRSGLDKLKKQIEDSVDKIREERKTRGLENRG